MAQRKAQGSLTIIDTTDIARIKNWYLASASSSGVTTSTSGWTDDVTNTNAIMTATKQYLWNYQQIQGIGPNGTYITINTTFPIIIGRYGQNGTDGASITGAKEIYYLTTGTAPSAPSAGTNITSTSTAADVWTTAIPTYIPNGTYYTSIQTSLSKGTTPIYSAAVKNQALTDACYNSAMAQSIAQNANENAQGAMSQAAANIQTITRIWYAKANSTAPAAPTSHVTTSSATTYNAWNIKRPNSNDSYPYYFYCDETCTGGGVYSWSEVTLDTSNLSQYQIGALTAKVKNFWWDSSGAHVASGKNGNEVTQGTVSTYGYHALMGLTGINFNYDGAKVIDLNSTTPSLDFYQPPTISGNTVTQGKKTMMLSANALRFYNPSNGTTEQAILDTNGLVLKRGGIEAGSKNTTDYIYVWSYDEATNHTININNSGNKSDWRIIAGNKFGVDKAGNLYASNAKISGAITVGDGSNVYTKTESDGNYDASGSASAAQAAAISAAATDATNKANAAQAAAQTAAQGYANTAEANASYSVEIQVTAIDYVNNSATLVAIPYYQGSTTMPTGVTLSYQWYKNGTALANTSTAPTISGVKTNTLQLGEGADFGSSTTNAIYTCVIS